MSAVLLLDPHGLALAGAWPARPWTPEEIATRLSVLLSAISEHEPAINGWKRQRPKTVVAGDDVAGLAKFVTAGAIKDSQKPPVHIEAAGYLLYLNAVGVPGLQVKVSAGQVNDRAISTCAVYPPRRSNTLRSAATAQALLRVLVGAFDPAWAVWTNHTLSNAEHVTADGRTLGFLNYGPAEQMHQLDANAVNFHDGAIATLGDDPEIRDLSVVLRHLTPASTAPTDTHEDNHAETTFPGWEPRPELLLPIGSVVQGGGKMPEWATARIDDGIDQHHVGEQEYRVWQAAHSTRADTATAGARPWGPEETTTAARALQVAEPEPWIASLLRAGLLARVRLTTEEAATFCHRHRLRSHLRLRGTSTDVPRGESIQWPGQLDRALSPLTAEVSVRALTAPNLWAACGVVAARYEFRQTPTEPQRAVAEMFLTDLHRLLAAEAATIVRVV
ncbi:hypothetical protein [Ruania zhangjianzhongii]|uniref:hypothetical protein n=1 Tax=Ruania zhangjianzhongii TaxID=2603206 RepID=UPI0011CB83F4|nr:hypothetical protein [Ruania zhangjianzhongii]